MEASAAIASLGALAQETRLQIFRMLVQAGPDGLPAGTIGERLSLPLPTLSFHLNQLRQAALVMSRRESRSIIYAAKYDTMNSLLTYLTKNCCQGQSSMNDCSIPSCAPPKRLHQNLTRRSRREKGRAAI